MSDDREQAPHLPQAGPTVSQPGGSTPKRIATRPSIWSMGPEP
jgi:hypothetical protein